MTDPGSGETRNIISGGTQRTVLQGRDFRDVHIGDIVHAATVPVALAQLPALVAGFTGRDAELAEITALLDPAGNAGAVVVSAVAGLAGVGKTALAIQAAHGARQTGWFPGGVLFIDLHGYDDAPVQPDQALDALLRALGITAEHIPPSTEERAGLYRSVLAQISQPVLIIADNASTEAQVRPLLPGLGPHRVVVTSRHTLAGLGARLLDVAVLGEEAAMALVAAALRDARPDDDRIVADRAGAVRLAGICGGLPLALQITAALLKADPSRTLSDLADELGDEIARLEVLRYDDGGGTSAPSVAAAFELSYRRLDDVTARVFRLLPVNPGPDVSIAAAAALADLPAGAARKAISQLVRAHLVEAAAGAVDRWRMHDLLRLYARQLSSVHADTDAREQACDQLLRYYTTTAAGAYVHLKALAGTRLPPEFTSRDNALAWLDSEQPNLIAAVTMAADSGRDQIAIFLPICLSPYLGLRRRFNDMFVTMTACLNAARRLHDREHEATACSNLGNALQKLQRLEEGINLLQDAAVIYREIGNRKGEGAVLGNISAALLEAGRFEESIATCRDAAAIFRETGDRHGEGMVLTNLGAALRGLGRFEDALSPLQDAAAICQETGDRHGEGMVLSNLGDVLVEQRRFKDAVNVLRDAAAIHRETGDRHGECDTLSSLGATLMNQERFEDALGPLQNSAAHYRETGDWYRECMALSNFGSALLQTGQTEQAIIAYQDTTVRFRENEDKEGEAITLINLSAALLRAKRLNEAVAACQDAAAIFREIGNRQGEGLALNNLNAVLQEAGQAEEAIVTYQDKARKVSESEDEGA